MDLCWSNHVVQGLTVHTHIHISYVIYISYHFVCVCVKWEIKRNIYQTTSSSFLRHGIIRDFISHIHLFFLFIYVFCCARSSLCSLNRDPTQPSAMGVWSFLATGPPSKSLYFSFLKKFIYFIEV